MDGFHETKRLEWVAVMKETMSLGIKKTWEEFMKEVWTGIRNIKKSLWTKLGLEEELTVI